MSNGERITKKEAKILMEQQQGIVNAHRRDISSGLAARDKKASTYYLAKGNDEHAANCFIFDIKYFLEFKEGDATQVLAILGASAEGKPTIIMVGCVEDKSEKAKKKYKSAPMLGATPAVQHPPVIVQEDPPINGANDFSVTVIK